MNDALTLFAALLSAAAAAVGAAVSLAQWRQSVAQARHTNAHGTVNSAHAGAATERPESGRPDAPARQSQPEGPRQSQPENQVVQRPSRSAVIAITLATLCCVFTAVGIFAYVLRKAKDGAPPNPVEIFAILAIPISITSVVSALISLGAGGFRRNFRLSSLAILGCLTSWVALWIYGN